MILKDVAFLFSGVSIIASQILSLAHPVKVLANTSASAESNSAPRSTFYAPDRKMDVEHLTLDITPDFEKMKVHGKMILKFHPISKPLDEIELDAVDLNIVNVESNKAVANFRAASKKLTIDFVQPLQVGETASITVDYYAQPFKGLYFRVPANGYSQCDAELFTQGEMEESRYWFPSFDSPNEKLTSEIICRVPDGLTAISNGRLISSELDAATKLRIFHWLQDKPHANYLVTLVAGKFTSFSDQYKNIPLSFYVPPSDSKEAPAAFAFTKPIMEFFENEIGIPFPWAKYGQVVVKDFHYGGMENTSITTLADNYVLQTSSMEEMPAIEDYLSPEQIIAHEMAHQWFGDLLTCKDWANAWLNEGFATYYTLLFTGKKHGREEMLFGFWKDREKLSAVDESRPVVFRDYSDPVEQFDLRGYQKGSWVLRMLQKEVGEKLLREAVKKYIEKNQFKNVITQDLHTIIEELSGRSLDRFFDQWIYHAGRPDLEVSYSWNQKNKLAKISVRQTQRIDEKSPHFHFPLSVRLKGKDSQVTEILEVKRPEQDFYVSLPQAPSSVLIDPDLDLLSSIKFNPGKAMLIEQLKDKTETVGRLNAARDLAEQRDDESVKALKSALNSDDFVGVRIEAAKSLCKIHSNEALLALAASIGQNNPRARKSVIESLGKFYNPVALDALLHAIEQEKNPIITCPILRGLGSYHSSQAQTVLRKYLKERSYKQTVELAALYGMEHSDDPGFAKDIKEFLKSGNDMQPQAVSTGLKVLAYISRNEKPREEVREFIVSYLNDKNEEVQTGAVEALGFLEDPKAIPIVQTITEASLDSKKKSAAYTALDRLRRMNHPNDNAKDLRDEIVNMQKQNQQFKKDLEELRNRLEADSSKNKRRANTKTAKELSQQKNKDSDQASKQEDPKQERSSETEKKEISGSSEQKQK